MRASERGEPDYPLVTLFYMNEIDKFFYTHAAFILGILPLVQITRKRKLSGAPYKDYEEMGQCMSEFSPEERSKLTRKARKLVKLHCSSFDKKKSGRFWKRVKKDRCLFRSVLHSIIMKKMQELKSQHFSETNSKIG